MALPWFLARRVSANAVSMGGLCLGALAAAAYANWRLWPFAVIGFLLSIAWMIADGLDGMIARATGTASALGRFLDGLCDHGVFLLIYLALAASIGTLEAWILAACAGAIHGVQSSLYEGERGRFHRRCKGMARVSQVRGLNPLVRLYDGVAGLVDSYSPQFDQTLARDRNPLQLGAAYGFAAARPLRLMSLLSANVRVYAIFLCCLAQDPTLFWWIELVPMTAILVIGLSWHRVVEARLIRNMSLAKARFPRTPPSYSKDVTN